MDLQRGQVGKSVDQSLGKGIHPAVLTVHHSVYHTSAGVKTGVFLFAVDPILHDQFVRPCIDHWSLFAKLDLDTIFHRCS